MPVPANLSKLSDVVTNVVKKAVYDKLVEKINYMGTSGFVLKTNYDTGKAELEKKISDMIDLVKKTKLTELENKIPDVSGLATKSALTAVENKMPDVSSLVKKTDNNPKISELEKKLTDNNHDKYITTADFTKLTVETFAANLKQVNFDDKLESANQKINSNKTKHLFVENELEKLKAFESSYFIGKSHFEEDGTQNFLEFQPVYRYFNCFSGVGSGSCIYFLKFKVCLMTMLPLLLQIIRNSIQN